ncbi:MAG: hypothetical protein KBC33_01420 [Candidatus Pacebacteria bacterium]|nr:hypothetical protein [Candidatus Paceibacterota bacterium]
MSTSTIAKKSPVVSPSRAVVSLKGNITASSKISSRIAPLVESFLNEAGLKGNFTFHITGPNDCVTFHAEDWIRIRSEGNGGSCGMIVRIGTNDCRYGGYLHSQSGHPPQYLFTSLSRYTEKGYWQPLKLQRAEKAPVLDAKANKLSHDGDSRAFIPVTDVTTKSPSVPQPTEVTPSIPPLPAVPQHESMTGMSNDLEALKVIRMAIREHYPMGRAPVKGLTFAVISKLGLRVSPNAMGPVFRGMINRGLMKVSEDKHYYELAPDEATVLSPASPAVPEKESSSTTPPQVTPVAVPQPTDPVSMLAQIETLIEMARELGQASEKSAQIIAQIENIQNSIASKEAEISVLNERLRSLETQRTEISKIMNSEQHKRARNLMAQMRDMSLS